jgi:hypothetical protein
MLAGLIWRYGLPESCPKKIDGVPVIEYCQAVATMFSTHVLNDRIKFMNDTVSNDLLVAQRKEDFDIWGIAAKSKKRKVMMEPEPLNDAQRASIRTAQALGIQ